MPRTIRPSGSISTMALPLLAACPGNSFCRSPSSYRARGEARGSLRPFRSLQCFADLPDLGSQECVEALVLRLGEASDIPCIDQMSPGDACSKIRRRRPGRLAPGIPKDRPAPQEPIGGEGDELAGVLKKCGADHRVRLTLAVVQQARPWLTWPRSCGMQQEV